MRTRSQISLLAIGLALSLGSSALAFDPPRPGAGAATAGEVDPPRPPGSIPRGVAPAAMPSAPLPARALPPQTTPALAVPMPVEPRLGNTGPLDPPTAPAYAAPNATVAPLTPFEAFRSGAQMLRHGDKSRGLKSLQYAADQGVVAAQWKLARMYADGDDVEQSDLRAFELFSRIADLHAEDPPGTQQARYVSNAFVALGNYYAEGIPGTHVTQDIGRARHMYFHAAIYFGDPEAQYFFGRILLEGVGGEKDPRRAAQWFNSAANKGQYQAQAMLGRMLFKGEPGVPRQPARGLMWLSLAKDNVPKDNAPGDRWIGELYTAAFNQSTVEDRVLAGEYLVRWIGRRRD